MIKDGKLTYLKARLQVIKSRGKDIDCPGVVKKLERQIRKLEG